MRGTEKCPYGATPDQCPDALGICIDGIRWDDEGWSHPYSKWRPVCIDRPGICPHVTDEPEVA